MDNIIIDKFSDNLTCSFAVRSDIGGREQQQDKAYLCIHEDKVFAVVCDGMGGMMDGAVASDIALSSMRQAYVDCHSENGIDVPAFLYQAMISADKAVLTSMTHGLGGTTLVAAIIQRNQMYWASVGDSRLYIIRSGKILQATRDHNYQLRLDEMLKQAEITPDLYQKEMYKGEALLSYIGKGNLTLYDLTQTPLSLQHGDTIMLATDGLFNALSNEDLRSIIMSDISTTQKADSLMQLILKKDNRESQDNTTFILIDIITEAI